MANNSFEIELNEKELTEALNELEEKQKSIDRRWIKNTLRRKAKPILSRMKSKAHSNIYKPVLGITTAKSRAGQGIKVGVTSPGSKENFPDLNAYALASTIEYGTVERYRTVKAGGFITGRAPTGSITPKPWIRPAWDAEIKGVLDDFENTVIKRVEKAK